jgi:predicted Zn-dependent protease with MMP-like domain
MDTETVIHSGFSNTTHFRLELRAPVKESSRMSKVHDRITTDWDALSAPSLAEFELLAEAAFARLPDKFRALCRDVVIRVADFPDEDVLEELNAEGPFDLLGLFTGVGLAQDGAVAESGRLPNHVHLYRRPILDYWAEHEETLGSVVTHVLVHEIGHHFGMSDEDMERIEALADQGSA